MPFTPPADWSAAQVDADRWVILNPFVGMWVMAIRQRRRWYFRVYDGGTLRRKGFESVAAACEYASF